MRRGHGRCVMAMFDGDPWLGGWVGSSTQECSVGGSFEPGNVWDILGAFPRPPELPPLGVGPDSSRERAQLQPGPFAIARYPDGMPIIDSTWAAMRMPANRDLGA